MLEEDTQNFTFIKNGLLEKQTNERTVHLGDAPVANAAVVGKGWFKGLTLAAHGHILS